MKTTTTNKKGKPKTRANGADGWPKEVKSGSVTVRYYRRIRANGSHGFEVADYTTGHRVLRSFPTEEGARAEAERIRDLIASGERHALEFSGADRASHGRAVALIQHTGLPLELVAANYAKAYDMLGGDRILEAAQFFKDNDPSRLVQRTTAEVVAELLEQREKDGASDRYLQDLKSRLNRFAESFKVQIANIQPQDIQLWLDRLDVSRQTRKNFRTVIGTLFNYAASRGYIMRTANPAEQLDTIKVVGGDTPIYTPTEITRLLAAASPAFRPCIAIGAFAGLRSAEIERLEWADVDLVGGHIILRNGQAKTKSRRVVPLQPNLAEWLTPYAGKRGNVWPGTHEDFYGAQGATAAATATKTQDPVAWKPNALRHSFGSYRLAMTQNDAQVALEMGNSREMVHRHYKELVTKADAQAWFNVKPAGKAKIIPLAKARG